MQRERVSCYSRGTSSVGWQPWLWLHGFKGYTATTNGYNGAAMFGRRSGSFAQIVLLSTFYGFLLSLLTRITYALMFTTKEHLWTLDTATLICFRTLYP